MKRLTIVAAMLAMLLMLTAPAKAETAPLSEDQYGVVVCVDGVDGGVCYDPDEPATCGVLGDEAQAFLDLELGSESDREILDPDGNGVACDDPEEQPPDNPGEKTVLDDPNEPTGAGKLPDTGDPTLFALGAGGLLILGGLLLHRIAR